MTAQANKELRPFIASPLVRFIIMYLADKHVPIKCSPIHTQLCDTLSAISERKDDEYTLIIDFARGFGKSTYASKFWPLYLAMEGPYTEIQMIGQTGGSAGVATRNLGWIKNELDTNIVLQYDYRYKKGNAWGQDHIQIIRADGTTIEMYSRGKGCAIRGQRGILILDDLQDEVDVESETVLATDELWFKSGVLPVLTPGLPMVMIGSALSPLSLLSKCKEMPDVNVMEFPALDDNGESIWPEGRSTEWLKKKKAKMGDMIFDANYMCRPMVSGNPVFQREWFRSYDRTSAFWQKVRGGGLFVITAADGAYSAKKTADYTAIVTVAKTMDVEPSFYVLNVVRAKMTLPSGAESIYTAADNHNANLVFIESDKVNPPDDNDPMVIQFKQVMEQHGRRFVLDWEHPTRDKVSRAYGIQGLVQNGRVFFDHSDPKQLELMNEMQMFTGDQKFHDDMVDALVHAITKGLEEGCPEMHNGPIIVRAGARRQNVGAM